MPAVLLEQRTPEWLAARKGKITASLAAACLWMEPEGGRGAFAAFQEITGRHKQATNKAMEWGIEMEGRARRAYETLTGEFVEPTGFWVHDGYPWLGGSPDGLVGDEGGLELKCPKSLPTEIPRHHAIQCRVNLAVTDRKWWDYFAWAPEGHFKQRIERDMDAELILVAALQDFYTNYVSKDIAPPRRRPK